MGNSKSLHFPLPAILIVDDNPYNLQVLGKLLQDNNYAIEFALNGEAALEWLNTKQFDLVLLDINMPGMNGFEACMKIRSNPGLIQMPVIFLSADTDRKSVLKGFELGAQDYITKPFDSREILVRVKTQLTLREGIERLEKLNKSLEGIVIARTEELIKANEKLEILNLRLLDLDEAKSEFLHLISHEIRTPLNGIIGPVELLKEYSGTQEIIELIEILDLSVRRLERFSLNALLITRLKTKQFEIRNETISVPDLINVLLSERDEKLQSGNLSVNLRVDTPEPQIEGEPELIKICIGNIIDNSISHSPNGGTIQIEVFNEDESINCVIKDHGDGFKEGDFDKLFELFSKGDPKTDASPGIGLPISKMIMETHRGSISVGNNQPGGAYVKLQFHRKVEENVNLTIR